MSTDLRNVPNLDGENKITQTRFWGGMERKVCLQLTQAVGAGRHKHLQLTREQAKALAVELMLFAEGREVEDI